MTQAGQTGDGPGQDKRHGGVLQSREVVKFGNDRSYKEQKIKYVITMMAMVVFMVGAAHAQVITNNMVYYWQFESNYVDSVGNLNMSGVGSPTFGSGANAQVGTYALNVTGADYAQTVANVGGGLLLNSVRTMSLWFKQNGGNGNQATVSWGTEAGNGTKFENLLLSGLSCCHFWGVGYDNSYGAPSYSADTWTHFAITWDGSFARTYHNGVHIPGADWGPAAINTQVSLVYAGGGNGSFGTGFAGAIDDVAVWTRVLSDADILAIYNAGAAGNDIYSLLSSGTPGTLIYGK